MARRNRETCPICFKLFQETNRQPANALRWGYACLPVLGSREPQPMKRLYVRGEAASYKGIGYICDAGHVVLDQPVGQGPRHHLTPSLPHGVICQPTGEKVTVSA